jgi:Cu2+-exporting ATPase
MSATTAAMPRDLVRAEGRAAARACAHCGSDLKDVVVEGEGGARYCCNGCLAVGALMRGAGLERYYALRGGREAPITLADPSRRDMAWLAPIAAPLEQPGVHHVALDVQGVHCAACVWVIDELCKREPNHVRVVVDPALGRVDLWARAGFDLAAFVRTVERFGYVFGPPLKKASASEDGLLVRTGVTVALAMNAMTFALAIYLGLADGAAFSAARVLEVGLSAAAVLVGAPPFLSSAWAGLRRGLFSLDVPIALGIVLAGTSTAIAVALHHDTSYADTLAVFVALMLVGRWIAERALHKDRARLLADPGADGLYARRIEGGAPRLVRASAITTGDVLVVGPGEVLPVASMLRTPTAFALDWISGEPDPRPFAAGETVPAGAIHTGSALARVVASEPFENSSLRTLLASSSTTSNDTIDGFWGRVSRAYVGIVLVLATIAFGGWLLVTHDAVRALDVATALLVVTCPCGIGIATPLAYGLVRGQLARAGLYLRTRDALDRAHDVRRVVLDKTGTLTTARPHLRDTAPLAALSEGDRAALAALARASSHPASAAVAAALEGEPATELTELAETLGQGVEGVRGGEHLRLGRASWALASAGPEAHDGAEAHLVFAVDGVCRAELALDETLRPDAREELAALEALGIELRILSGDTAERVQRVASEVGIAAERAEGGASPDRKAERIAALDHRDTLFVGDGVNDTRALETAFLSGTPSIERPFVPARADFYFVTPGLAPMRALLLASRRLRRIARGNLAFAIAYNALAVSLAMAGLMQPWLAAVMMPASSIFVVAMTRLRTGGAAWTH